MAENRKTAHSGHEEEDSHSTRERRSKILFLIQRSDIPNQTALKDALMESGFDVSQPTLSRDIKALNLVKIRTSKGTMVYRPQGDTNAVLDFAARIRNTVKRGEVAGNLLVLTTERGAAPLVGAAIDEANWPDVAGAIAGDNTLMLVVRNGFSPEGVYKHLVELGMKED